jgi:tetratricopeptide (TPR) repeat protein
MTAHRVLGRLFASRGDVDKGLSHLQRSATLAEELIRTEPDNTEWAQFAASGTIDLGELQLAVGKPEAAGISARAGCAIAARLVDRDASVVQWRATLRGECLGLRAKLALARNAPAEAQALAAQRVAIARSELARGRTPESEFALADAELLRGEVAMRLGDLVAARSAWQAAAAAWPRQVELNPEQLARQALLLQRLGQAAEAQQAYQRLAEMGYRHPAFVVT